MADITVDVNLPSTISVDVTSPTQALATNISIPGPQGPRGEKGNPTSINSLNAENIIITGADGNIVYATGLNTIFISGNSGYFQSAVNSLTINLNTLSGLFTGHTGNLNTTYATDGELASTGSVLNIKIDILSGYVNSQDSNISNNLASTGSSLQSNINILSSNLNSTGSNLENKITSLSGTLTGNYLTTNVASNTYATITNLNSTGNTLNSNINSLSGTLTSNYATITNLSNTGSSLVGTINSLSGTLTSNYATITNLASTGATLNNNINSLSGTLTSNYATITNLASTGSTLVSSINSLNSAFTGFTGNLDATYATDSQLTSTGTTLISTINSLSGTLTGNYLTTNSASSTYATIINLASTGSTLTTNLASTGSTLQTNINNLSNTYATIINLASTGSNLNNTINSLSGTVTGNYVTKSNGQFTNRPTVNGTGILLSGEAASLPTTILYTTGNQIKSGRLIIGDTIVDPNSPYTLSLQTNYQDTFLEILNSGGSGEGVFVGINRNDFEQYNWQGGDIVFFTAENVSDGVARLTIKNDGKVGIGTSSPSEKLEVVGNIKVTNSGFFNSGIQVGTGVYIEPNRILINGDAVVTRSELNVVSGYFEAENIIGYKVNLTQGSDNYYVQFPQVLPSAPKSVICAFQNTIDDMAYYFSLGSINPTGFYINFSDILLNNGYYLNIQVKK